MNEQLDLIADYADRLAGLDKQATANSMAVAHALDELYESRVWVAEWLEQKPRPKNGGSNRWKEDSRNRFNEWQTWKQQQRGRRPLTGRYAYMLMDGVRVEKRIPNLNSVQIGSEITLRPLKWMLTNKYEDRIPEVWPIAVELAGSPDKVTAAHTREALKQWKSKTFGKRLDGTPRKSAGAISAAALAAGKANRLRRNIIDEIAELYRLACINEKAQDEYRDLFADIDAFLDEHTTAA